ncbi:hypothetical protein HU200_000458 [Digitaria exilis]|uniref:Uncharacterized protein n=1 Tax=Digitaria exilis TaxID=1010633 RepID=A0A835G260_9POAL|nr:hypothetical protein HU200_000458 [Digitaria exilis]
MAVNELEFALETSVKAVTSLCFNNPRFAASDGAFAAPLPTGGLTGPYRRSSDEEIPATARSSAYQDLVFITVLLNPSPKGSKIDQDDIPANIEDLDEEGRQKYLMALAYLKSEFLKGFKKDQDTVTRVQEFVMPSFKMNDDKIEIIDTTEHGHCNWINAYRRLDHLSRSDRLYGRSHPLSAKLEGHSPSSGDFRHARGSEAKLEGHSPSSGDFRHARGSAAKLEGGIHPRAVISVTLEAPQPSSRGAFTLERRFRHARGSAAKLEGGIHPRAVISVTLEAPQPSSRGAFILERRFRHPRGSAAKLEGHSPSSGVSVTLEARKARACDPSSKRMVEAAAPARAALAAGNRLPPDMAGCPRSRCTPLASADSALAVASPPRTAGFCRRRRCPPVQSATFASRVLLFPRPVSSRLAHARLPPAVLACAALTPRTAPTRPRQAAVAARRHRAAPHPSTPLSLLLKPSTVPLPQHAGKTSPELAEPPPSLLSWAALAVASPLPYPPLPLTEPFPTRFPHQSRWRSSPELTELSAAAAHVHSPLYSSSSRTEGTISFLVPRWCSPTASPSLSDLDAAGRRSPEQAEPPPPSLTLKRITVSPSPFSPHFPGPVSPPFGRRNHTGELEDLVVSSTSFQGAERKMQGLLVPAAEEIAQESEVNVVHVDPSPEQEYRFEPEGKPRSLT